MTEVSNEADEEAVLLAKLTTAIGRVDAGSAGGYAFRYHVAKTDLLPLVKTLIAEAAREAHSEAARLRMDLVEVACAQREWTDSGNPMLQVAAGRLNFVATYLPERQRSGRSPDPQRTPVSTSEHDSRSTQGG